jgi:broad specificity phosphatase PhoE
VNLSGSNWELKLSVPIRSTTLILVKHASPVLEATVPPRDWVLSAKGEAEADRLGQRLREFLPFRLVSSSEPKALRTAEIIGAALGVATHSVDGLREIDRRPLPIMTPDAHRQMNAVIFAQPDRPTLGSSPPGMPFIGSALRSRQS